MTQLEIGIDDPQLTTGQLPDISNLSARPSRYSFLRSKTALFGVTAISAIGAEMMVAPGIATADCVTTQSNGSTSTTCNTSESCTTTTQNGETTSTECSSSNKPAPTEPTSSFPSPAEETPTPPAPAPRKPKPKPKPQEAVTAADRPQPKAGGKAPAQALAALSSLNTMQNKVDVSKLQNKNLSEKGGQAKANTRSSLGQENLNSSGGLKNADMDMQVKGAALAQHQGTAIDSPIAYLDLPDEGGSYSEGARGRRDMESIRRTIENTKGSVYALYAKALRQHPDLSGKFVFELVVEPDGTVSRLRLIRSDLSMPDLEQKMLAKVSGINFGEDKVAPTKVQYTFVLIPS